MEVSAEPTLIAGEPPVVRRRVLLWRRLEPGDVRTPGTELAPESPNLEAKVVEVGIGEALLDELKALDAVRADLLDRRPSLMERYEPAGVILALGGGVLLGTALDYLPDRLRVGGLALVLAAAAVGAVTRARKRAADARTEKQWSDRPEREALSEHAGELASRWATFSDAAREEGFRTEVFVGDVDDAERLASVDVDAIARPSTWAPDASDDRIRYVAIFRGGATEERVAELEESDA